LIKVFLGLKMSNYPLVSIIILNFNGRAFLADCLRSVLKSSYPHFEIIVVDNHSSDGSQEYLKKMAQANKRIKPVFSDQNLYFAGGNNLGANHARGQYLIFLNNDTVVEKNWLKELVNFAQKHPLSLVQPKILNFWKKNIIDNVGGKYTFWGFGYGIGRGEKDIGQYNQNSRIDYVNGTCFLIKKTLFKKLGGFNKYFRYFYEDVDLSLRAKETGSQCWYCYRSVIYHRGGASFKKNKISRLKIIYYSLRNRFLVFFKKFFLPITKIS